MHDEVKKRVDNKDIRGLQFVFADCLDVDPTFEKYKEDYEYCRKMLPEMFESHIELIPFNNNQSDWTDDYWNNIKMDLLENFSIERFGHMQEVVKVVYAEKIERLIQERETARKKLEQKQQESEAAHKKIEQKNSSSEDKLQANQNETLNITTKKKQGMLDTKTEVVHGSKHTNIVESSVNSNFGSKQSISKIELPDVKSEKKIKCSEKEHIKYTDYFQIDGIKATCKTEFKLSSDKKNLKVITMKSNNGKRETCEKIYVKVEDKELIQIPNEGWIKYGKSDNPASIIKVYHYCGKIGEYYKIEKKPNINFCVNAFVSVRERLTKKDVLPSEKSVYKFDSKK
jgi:hypothetical protein